MRKRLQDQSDGGERSRDGSWAQTFRYFYAAEAKAAGMPVDRFLDLMGNRLDDAGKDPNISGVNEERKLCRQHKGHAEVRENFLGIDSIA